MVSTATMRESSPRKCSSNGQHNSKTGVRLFGVRIDIDPKLKIKKKVGGGGGGGEFIRKSKSLGNLELFGSSSVAANDHRAAADDGYHSDGIIHTSKNRKKGTLWSREEHRSFLVGLEKLGKGDWKGISKTYVPSRTPSQVASHAQKYFIRKATKDKRKRRSSVFDVDLNDSNPCVPPSQASPSLRPSITNNDPEVLKEASVSVSPVEQQLIDTKESKGQANRTASSATHERPPISPMSRPFGVSDLRHMSNSMGVPRNMHGFTSNKGLPTFSWVPVFNYHNPNHINIVPNFSGPCFAPYGARPSTGVSRQTPP